MIQFEWDPAKAKINLRKHSVAFREAASVLKDLLVSLSLIRIIPTRKIGSSLSDSRLPVGF
jgi:hypothetical protein